MCNWEKFISKKSHGFIFWRTCNKISVLCYCLTHSYGNSYKEIRFLLSSFPHKVINPLFANLANFSASDVVLNLSRPFRCFKMMISSLISKHEYAEEVGCAWNIGKVFEEFQSDFHFPEKFLFSSRFLYTRALEKLLWFCVGRFEQLFRGCFGHLILEIF